MASSTTSISAGTPNHNPFALIDPTGVIAHNPHFAPIGLTVPIGSTALTAPTVVNPLSRHPEHPSPFLALWALLAL